MRTHAATAVDAHVYFVPSAPDRPLEYQDCPAVSPDRTVYALCDGASSAYRAGPWGRLLAAAYTDEGPDRTRESVVRWIERCCLRWDEEESRRRKQRGEVSFWVADAETRGVAAATLLGLKLFASVEGWSYEAVAVGDTCLLHVQGDRLLSAHPLDDPAAFDSHPDLLTSRAEPWTAAESIRSCDGRIGSQDMLVLASDALAQVLLERAGSAAGPDAAVWWQVVRRLDARAFTRLVTELRTAGIIETDDTTLIRICPRTAP
ncbi:hypothetical protein ACWC24_13080 [Streptomyces sp. NPDC001443]